MVFFQKKFRDNYVLCEKGVEYGTRFDSKPFSKRHKGLKEKKHDLSLSERVPPLSKTENKEKTYRP
jgi:hypothetical protein